MLRRAMCHKLRYVSLKLVKMKTRYYLLNAVIASFLAIGWVCGQTTPPVSVSIDSRDHYQHGYNKNGGPFIEPSDPNQQETRDSVTVTSVMQYFVFPDVNKNPGYDPADPLEFDNVWSTFDWTLKNSLGTGSSTTPLIEITWGATPGIDSVIVTEIAVGGAACAGNRVSMPVTVIAKPTFRFDNSTHTAYRDSACHANVSGANKAAYNFPVITASPSTQLQIDYTVEQDGSPVPLLGQTNVNVVNGTGVLTLEFENYGAYEVTVTKITDRVSRKPVVPVSGDLIAGADKFTYIVMPPAQTGPIYRIPNNYE